MNWTLLLVQLLLIALGSLGMATANDPDKPLLRHLLVAAAGLSITMIVAQFRPRFFVRFGFIFWLISAIALVAVLFLSHSEHKRWISLGLFDLQPSEFAMIGIITYMASFFSRKGHDARLRGPIVVVGLTMSLVVVEPDLSMTLVVGFLAFAVMVIGGLSRWRLAAIIVFAGCIAFVGLTAYVGVNKDAANRIAGFFDKNNVENTSNDLTYQYDMAQRVIIDAGFWGRGPDMPMRANVPVLTSDMIAVAVGHSTGLLGISVIFVAFALVWQQGSRVSHLFMVYRSGLDERYDGEEANWAYGIAVLAGGATVLLVTQAALNLAGALAAIPNPGGALPMVSWGGSNMLASGIAFGLLQSAWREWQRLGQVSWAGLAQAADD
jgi:cell division protein FtsW